MNALPSVAHPEARVTSFRSPGALTYSAKFVKDAVRSCATRAAPALAAKTAGRVAAGNWTPPTATLSAQAA